MFLTYIVVPTGAHVSSLFVKCSHCTQCVVSSQFLMFLMFLIFSHCISFVLICDEKKAFRRIIKASSVVVETFICYLFGKECQA